MKETYKYACSNTIILKCAYTKCGKDFERIFSRQKTCHGCRDLRRKEWIDGRKVKPNARRLSMEWNARIRAEHLKARIAALPPDPYWMEMYG